MKIFRKFLCSLSAIAMLVFAGCLTACVGGLDFSSSSSNSEENEEPVRIIAVYEQSAQVFADTPLDDLRKDLTVSVETSLETVTETDDYTLSGTLEVGESEITVTYNPVPALTATFNVSVGEPHTHVFTNYVSNGDATCQEDGTKTAVCDDENCEETDTVTDVGTKLAHVFTNYVSDGNATCQEDGTKTAVCDREDCEETDTVEDEDSTVDHAFENYVSNNDATCQEDGTKTGDCKYGCGTKDTIADVGTKLDHVFINYVSNDNATCAEDGTKTGDCKYGCGTKDTIADVGTKLAHVFTNYVSDDNATCQENGTKTAVCDREGCEEADTIADVGTKLDHVFTNYVSDDNATCMADGTKTAKCDYKNCEETDTITEEGTKLTHVFTNYVSDGNATCMADGTKTAKCDYKNCEETDTQPDVGSAREHIYTNYVSNNDATCTQDGTKTAKCDNGCGTTKTIPDEGSKKGHSFTNYVSDGNATCEENGTETATCDRKDCQEEHTRTEENSKLGHSFTNYISDGNATCTEDGTKTATCDREDCEETDTIADENSKLGHSFTNYVSDNNAELGKDGTKTAVCDRENCEETDTVTDEGSALEHSYTNYVSDNNATCTQDGTKTAKCDNGCGTTKTIPDEGSKKGHTFTNYVSDGTATCTEDGTETATCDNGCGSTQTRTKANSALGHSHTPTVTAPTCTEQGFTTHTCVCGDSYVDTYVNALGHSYTNYESNEDATCTEDGTKTAKCDNGCKATDTVTDEGSAFGHSFTNYVSNGDATCTEDGTKTAKCDNNCGATDTVADTGSMLDHEYTNYVSNGDATCEADGTKTASCKYGCGETDTVADEGSALGHTFQQSKCVRCSATNHLSIVTAPSVTSIYYGEQPTFTGGEVQNELGETVTSGAWSITGVSDSASATTKEIAAKAFLTFTPNGTEYAPVSQEIDVTLLAVAQYGNNYYATVDGALEIANKSNSGTVYVFPLGYDLDSGRAKIAKTIAVVEEIKLGVTFTLPYAENALDTIVSYVLVSESNEYKTSAYGKTQFLTNQIYIAEGHTLANAGTINVAGEVSSGAEVNYNANSVTAGRHAQINLGANAKLVSTGTVNCYGFINEERANNGSEFIVEAGNATVMFTIVEYRGPRIYLGMMDPSNQKVKADVIEGGKTGKYTPDTLQASPFNRFYIESVTAKTTVKYGAQMLGHAVLRAYSENHQTTLNLINNSNAILALTGQGGWVTYKYDPSTHKTDLDIYGDMTLNPLQLKLNLSMSGFSVELTFTTGAVGDSDGVFFPISDYFDISLNAVGGSATVNTLAQKLKLLPGAKITVGEGVVVNASEIAVYANNNLLVGGVDKHYKTNTPAELIVKGTLNVQSLGGAVIAGGDNARLNISKSASLISKEIKTATGTSKLVVIELLNKGFEYVIVTYSSATDSTLAAAGATSNGDPIGVNKYIAQNGLWIPANLVVQYNLNGGTASATSQSFAYGYEFKASDLLVPEREYYDFAGWYTTENFESGTQFESVTLTKNLTLYAKWEQKAGIVLVEFKAVGTDANDVEITKTFASQIIDSNSRYAVEPTNVATYNDDVTYQRYVAGYYLDEACTVAFSFSQELTQNTTIYVKWENKIKVTIGSGTSSVTAGGKTVTATEFYVVPNTEIVVTAKSNSGLSSKKTVTITESYGKNNASAKGSLFSAATATLTFTAEGDTTISVAHS